MKYKFILYVCFFSFLLSTNVYASNHIITKEQAIIIKDKANQGDAEAINNLGIMYENGLGVKQSFSKAKELYEKSCDNGFQKGCDNDKILNLNGY